jgi:hypothetical protein
MNLSFIKVGLLAVTFSGFLFFTSCQNSADNAASDDETADVEASGFEDLDEDDIQRQIQEMMMQQPELLSSEDISDEQLDKFVTLGLTLRDIETKGTEKMIALVEERGYSVEQYQQIGMMMQQGGDAGLTEDELNKFNSLNDELDEIQGNIQGQIMKRIEDDADIDFDLYQQIAMSISRDAALEERVQKLVEIKDQNKTN